MHHHAQLIFVLLVETGCHHIGQAGLKLLTASDLPASDSHGAGITGVSHCAQSLKGSLSEMYVGGLKVEQELLGVGVGKKGRRMQSIEVRALEK